MSHNLQAFITYLDSRPLDRDGMLSTAEYLRTADLSMADVQPYCIFSEESYQRNPIISTPAYELLLLCWMSGQASPIHDHFGSRCVFRIMQGTVTEVRCEDIGRERDGKQLVRPTAHRTYRLGEVCMSESLDIHEVANREMPGENLVTLHLYSPPLKMRTYELE